jgi:protein-L-isoaspartate(D-aspartate) O-methyltransferase
MHHGTTLVYCANRTRVSQGKIVNDQNFETMRRAMVASQLRTTAVSDPRIVAAMEKVAREDFVPDDRRTLAYVDVLIPMDRGRALNPPMVTGRLLNEAALRSSDKVLLIGAALGYSAAVLSEIVANVTAVEEDSPLSALATDALASRPNVQIVTGPLCEGAPDHGPFDVLIVDGAIEKLPDALTSQLAEGARAAVCTVDNGVTRLSRGTKIGGRVKLVHFADADCAVLPGFDQPKSFTF